MEYSFKSSHEYVHDKIVLENRTLFRTIRSWTASLTGFPTCRCETEHVSNLLIASMLSRRYCWKIEVAAPTKQAGDGDSKRWRVSARAVSRGALFQVWPALSLLRNSVPFIVSTYLFFLDMIYTWMCNLCTLQKSLSLFHLALQVLDSFCTCSAFLLSTSCSDNAVVLRRIFSNK